MDLQPEITYIELINYLSHLKRPRDKISKLLESGKLIRVKKGIYVQPNSPNGLYSKFVLANLIYGPSYISGNSALSFYGLIPERVHMITSTTCIKNKKFSTPLATFEYRFLKTDCYKEGYICNQTQDQNRSYLIASVEKVLCEEIYFERNISTIKDIIEWCLAKRIEFSEIKKLSHKKIFELSYIFKSKKIDLFCMYVNNLQKGIYDEFSN